MIPDLKNFVTPPLVSVVLAADGRAQIQCSVAKSEAVKLLLNVVEELRFQAFREESRTVQIAHPVIPTR